MRCEKAAGIPRLSAEAATEGEGILVPRGVNGFFKFTIEERAKLPNRRDGSRLPKQSFQEEQKLLGRMWSRLSDEERDRYNIDAQVDLDAKLDQPLDSELSNAMGYDAKDPFFGISDASHLITTKAFEDFIRSELGLAPDIPVPGFMKYQESLRASWCSDMYIADEEEIPDDKSV